MPNTQPLRLFHFSEAHDISAFVPRPVRVPSERPAGREWLNGPLVWAIDAAHAFMYLFPRDCPRLLAWAVSTSSPTHRSEWLGNAGVIAYVEAAWSERIRNTCLSRYEFDPAGFESLNDAGMWVSRSPSRVIERVVVSNLPRALAEAGVEVRTVEALGTQRALLATSLHVSAIRMRNAPSWAAAS